MKIGILTHFHKSINYGGVLQAYALCNYLNNQGHCAYQILYTHQAAEISPSFTPKKFFFKIISRVKKKVHKSRNKRIRARMESLFFRFRENVPHTQNKYTKSTIADAANAFDIFITGSDQVWNPVWYDSAYLLDFVKPHTPKISYAASLGVRALDEQQAKVFQAQLADFTGISVREQTAADALSAIVDQPVTVCVDPTLLLSAEDWNNIASERKIKESYVFLYFLGNDTHARKLAAEFAKTKGLKIVMIPDLLGAYRAIDRKIRAEHILDATPCDFISLIKHADYIFTDSFHACVFSLLYQKEFFAFKRGGSMEMGSRIQNLTELFDCPQRFCVHKNEQNLKHLLSLQKIDYSKRPDAFITKKQNSIAYLQKQLHEATGSV